MVKRIARTLGFTLIEMAIVLVIIGLVLSGGLVAVEPVIANSKVSQTNQRLDKIEQALVVHAVRYGCLPCPAEPGDDSSVVATAGQAKTTGGAYTNGCQAAACNITAGDNQLGVVPWVNLGLSEDDITDGFGDRISYALTPGLQISNAMQRAVSTYPSGTLVVKNIAGTELTNVAASSGAAYVMLSYGIDRVYAYRAQTGTQVTADPNNSVPQIQNSNGGGGTPLSFIQDVYVPAAGTGYFDDIVRWRSAPLIVQLCGSNSCGNPA